MAAHGRVVFISSASDQHSSGGGLSYGASQPEVMPRFRIAAAEPASSFRFRSDQGERGDDLIAAREIAARERHVPLAAGLRERAEEAVVIEIRWSRQREKG